jgi:hypothetical protein
VASTLICLIVSMPLPFTVTIEAPNYPGMIYWGATLHQEKVREFSGLAPLFPYRSIKSIGPQASEIELLDGRRVKFGKEPLSIDCKPEKCDEKVCVPIG